MLYALLVTVVLKTWTSLGGMGWRHGWLWYLNQWYSLHLSCIEFWSNQSFAAQVCVANWYVTNNTEWIVADLCNVHWSWREDTSYLTHSKFDNIPIVHHARESHEHIDMLHESIQGQTTEYFHTSDISSCTGHATITNGAETNNKRFDTNSFGSATNSNSNQSQIELVFFGSVTDGTLSVTSNQDATNITATCSYKCHIMHRSAHNLQ